VANIMLPVRVVICLALIICFDLASKNDIFDGSAFDVLFQKVSGLVSGLGFGLTFWVAFWV